MLEVKDIEKLAKLARIELSDAEKRKLLSEVDPILGYVSQIKEVVSKTGGERKAGEHRNIMREDGNAYEGGKNTETIVSEFPEKDRNYLKVKKIL